MDRILINKSNNLLRVARMNEQQLYDLEIENVNVTQNIDSICNAEVVSIEPSLNAAFANFGAKRNGFLPLKEIAPEYYPEKFKGQDKRPNIKDLLFDGQKILVQVNKEERGTKGAALSTYISLAGCFLVLMPNNPNAGGISRRIEGDERDELRKVLDALKIPNGMSVIIRTAGIGKSIEELQWDLDVLVKLWDSIKAASKQNGAPVLIHQESDVAIRSVRDHLRQNIGEILIDDEEVYKKVQHYIERVRPDFLDRVKLYTDKIPLFSRFQLEKQIESAYQRNVRLPSGGEIVIDRTEALIAIDVNSAQSTKGGDIEETALNTNLEAADEIAKQLRIRDLAGLIVVDFIDMDRDENNFKVEDHMREALRSDRARIQLTRLSRFGLLEMSRQRLRPTLSEASLVVCPRCHGQGSIRNIQSQAESILHLIEENALKKNINQVRVQLPIDLATYMLNEQRHTINKIESINTVSIIVIANPYLQTPQYQIEALNLMGDKYRSEKEASYEMISTPTVEYTAENDEPKGIEKRHAAVGDVLPDVPVPQHIPAKKPGFFTKLFKALFGTKKTLVKKHNVRNTTSPQRRPSNSRYNKSQRPERGPRGNKFRGRTRRPEGSRIQGRDDSRPARDDSRPTRDDSRPARDDSRPARDDSRPARDDSRPARDDSRPRRDNNHRSNRRPNKPDSYKDNRDRNRNRGERSSSNSPRQYQTQESRAPKQEPSEITASTETHRIPEQKPTHEPVAKQIIEPVLERQVKPAPRYAHTPTVKKETDNRFAQVETVHKAPEVSTSEIKQPTPDSRPRRARPVQSVKTISPENFVMIETKEK